jgi:superfamily II DNA helicase RecQ
VKITMVLVSPEELKSSKFGTLLDNETFSGCVYAMGMDEVHLLYFWGADFGPCFRQIGFVRARLSGHNRGSFSCTDSHIAGRASKVMCVQFLGAS